MHPPLIPEKHPICAEFIEALTRCHKEHKISMWWGACNDAKFDLTKCLALEKKELRAERQAKAKAAFREKRERDRQEREKRRQEQERERERKQQEQERQEQERQEQRQQRRAPAAAAQAAATRSGMVEAPSDCFTLFFNA